MEIEQRLNTTAKHVYDRIIDSVLYDIKGQTGQTISRSELRGYSYKKIFSNNFSATIEIVGLEEEKIYRFLTKTTRNTFDTMFEIEALDEKSCRVRYIETMESSGLIQRVNDMLVGLILVRLKKRQMKNLLLQIESSETVTL